MKSCNHRSKAQPGTSVSRAFSAAGKLSVDKLAAGEAGTSRRGKLRRMTKTKTDTRMPVLITPWVKVPQPNGEYVLRPGKPVVEEEEIGTRETAKILHLSQRRITTMCEEGILVEGRDWWRSPGRNRGGEYRIKREAILRIRYGTER